MEKKKKKDIHDIHAHRKDAESYVIIFYKNKRRLPSMLQIAIACAHL